MKSTNPGPVRRGFTLVELLAVIVIIGILASLSLYAAGRAMVAARNGKIVMDIKLIETDLQTYYGMKQSYPPDLLYVTGISPASRQQSIRSHLAKVAPRYTGPLPLLPDTPLVSSVNPEQARANIAAEALVFFLGGYSKPDDVKGSTKLLGFRADPANPFVINPSQLAAPGGWKKGSVGFDETRLVDLDGDGWFEYLPPHCTMPYVYFNAKTYMNPSLGTAIPRCDPDPAGSGGTALPYLSDNAQERFANPKTFQIISAGQDNTFGTSNVSDPTFKGKKFPSGSGYTTADHDNLTNFAERTLEDAVPQ